MKSERLITQAVNEFLQISHVEDLLLYFELDIADIIEILYFSGEISETSIDNFIQEYTVNG